MKPLLISACLLGVNCRYKGDGQHIEGLERLMECYRLIPVCPEQLGGLPTPRPPSERRGDRVVSVNGLDVTEQYNRGARETLRIAQLFNVRECLLKERSPSCGRGEIYDGSFSGTRVPGDGVTAALLTENGIRVYGESDMDTLIQGACEE